MTTNTTNNTEVNHPPTHVSHGTKSTREAMEALQSSERKAYYIAWARWKAVAIAKKEGTVHSREVREEMERAGVLHNYTGGDWWLGAVFNKFPAFRSTGKKFKYSDTTRNIHEREVTIWELVPGYDTSGITKPTKPDWLRNAE
jgi:hypothetical protein